jgi:dCTP deaminase
MILSDATIKAKISSGKIKLIPGEGQEIENIMKNIVCASMDLELGNEFRYFKKIDGHILNPFDDDTTDITEAIRREDGEDLIIHPGDFLLAATKERFGIPADIVARVEGRSSLGRL